ncbi:hypothetical protein [Neobacillus dielmonensis]|uniref:hypothetical protein n=1 Tax=Neobacillus dielmonensis TaxID=1347369 RepID=UPI0005A9DEAA|nr:hypothetical protein [Neobacillus dielmonensis]
MEPRQPGNKKLPDFQELNDRVIVDRPSSPMLVIKTNLDPKEPTEENPYFEKGETKNLKDFEEYFEE